MAGVPVAPHAGPVWTRPVIQNNTDETVTYFKHSYLHGQGEAKNTVDANRTEEFYHYADTQPPKASIGAVVYQITNNGLWVIAWENRLNVNNKAYTELLDPGKEIIWDVIFQRLEASPNTKTDEKSGFYASLVIDLTSGSPTLTAILEKKRNP